MERKNKNKELRYLTVTVLFSAISFLLMIFPKISIIPGASFLELEFSIIPIMLLAVTLGLRYALAALFLRTVLHLIVLNNGIGTLIGLPVNFVLALTFLVTFFYLREKNVWLSFIAATILLTLFAIVLNLYFAVPLYSEFMKFDINKLIRINKYIVSMILPFNLIEGIAWSFVYYLLSPISKTLLKGL